MANVSNMTVTFIDDSTGEAIGVTEIPAADLPESFAIETTLHLGEVDWSVTKAIPQTREEYSRTKSLTIHLRRIEKIDPRNILFSLPSICDRIPGLGSSPLMGNELVLAEDDWRQFELVSRRFAAETAHEIEAIRKIHEEESADIGWRKVHVRKVPDPPIVGPLALTDVARYFAIQLPAVGVTYRGANTQIESGYSFTASDGQRFYGLADNDKISVLGIVQQTLPSTPVRSIETLEQLAREFDLELVHWCRCGRASVGDLLFRKLLAENAA